MYRGVGLIVSLVIVYCVRAFHHRSFRARVHPVTLNIIGGNF